MSTLKTFIYLLFICVAFNFLSTSSQGQETLKKPKKLGTTIIKQKEISTFFGNFSRMFNSSLTADTTKGEFFYSDSGPMYIDVNYPLHQIMQIDGNITHIYYPELKQAFRLESTNPVILPLIPGLLAAIRPDYGLGDLGFELISQEIKGDTVIARWSNPKVQDKIGSYTIAEVNDQLVYTHYESPKAETKIRTNFSNYRNVSGIFFPTDISSIITNQSGFSYEKVLLEKLSVNKKVPSYVLNFKIPDDVKIENKKW